MRTSFSPIILACMTASLLTAACGPPSRADVCEARSRANESCDGEFGSWSKTACEAEFDRCTEDDLSKYEDFYNCMREACEDDKDNALNTCSSELDDKSQSCTPFVRS